MQSNLLKISILCISITFTSCYSIPREDYGRDRIQAICRAQKQYKKKNGHYGTLSELADAELIKDEMLNSNFLSGNSTGYSSSIKLTDTGYFATVIPSDFTTKAGMFYVDEKAIIKVHYGDDKIQPNDPDCAYSNGVKCVCRED